MRSGERWVAKRWPHFPELIKHLDKLDISYKAFHDFPSLVQFMRYIDQSDLVVTTDSLSLHLALGLKKKIVALFTCTSPWEIHGYDRTIKIVSPLLKKYFYSTKKSLVAGGAIHLNTVLKALKKFL